MKFFEKLRASFNTRSFRVGGYSVAAGAMVLAIVIAVNLFAGALPAAVTKIDTTSNQLFSISQQTEKLIGSLTQDVTIHWVVQNGYEDTTIQTLLSRYESIGDHVEVKKIDPDVYPTFVAQYASDGVYNNSLIVESGERYRYVSVEDIYVYDYSEYYYTGSYSQSFNGEAALTSAIDYVVSENLPKVYILTGHGESTLPATFSDAVEKENIVTEELSLLTAQYVPDDADCVLIYAPQRDISAEEKTLLEDYLGNGGNVVLITDPPQEGNLPNLEEMMAYYGIYAEEGIVVEGSQSNYAFGTPYYLLPDMNSHTITTPLMDAGYYVLLPIAQGLSVDSSIRETLTVTSLLTTSDAAFSKLSGYNLTTYEKEEGDINGPFTLAAAAMEAVDDDIYANVIWVSSASLLDEQTNTQVSGGNLDFFLNILNYYCESDGSSIAIHAKSLDTEYLTMDSGTSAALTVVFLGLIPAGYLAVGIVIWFRRKRR